MLNKCLLNLIDQGDNSLKTLPTYSPREPGPGLSYIIPVSPLGTGPTHSPQAIYSLVLKHTVDRLSQWFFSWLLRFKSQVFSLAWREPAPLSP